MAAVSGESPSDCMRAISEAYCSPGVFYTSDIDLDNVTRIYAQRLSNAPDKEEFAKEFRAACKLAFETLKIPLTKKVPKWIMDAVKETV